MKMPEEIILKPYVTEKSTMDMQEGKYTFKVDPKATKTEIRKAIEKLFQVKVLKVNTMKYEGKEKRMGVHVGRRVNWKKAIVKIDLSPQNASFLTEGGKASTQAKKYKTSIDEFGAMQ